MGAGIVATLAMVYLAATALGIAAAISVVRKAGYSPWWVLAGMVPLVGVVMVFAFAFADWPVLQELRRARASVATPRDHPGLQARPPSNWGTAPPLHPGLAGVTTGGTHPGLPGAAAGSAHPGVVRTGYPPPDYWPQHRASEPPGPQR
jgi:hypothetical protein